MGALRITPPPLHSIPDPITPPDPKLYEFPWLVSPWTVRMPVPGAIMDINRILAELRAERDRIDQAISALEAVKSTGGPRVGRPPKGARKMRRRGRMSAAGRARIAAAQRARWAKAKQAQASKPMHRRGRMSAAARRKMSRLMKQRWAQGKMKPRAKATPSRASKPTRHMSTAARRKIAAAQRARWARVKAQ